MGVMTQLTDSNNEGNDQHWFLRTWSQLLLILFTSHYHSRAGDTRPGQS